MTDDVQAALDGDLVEPQTVPASEQSTQVDPKPKRTRSRRKVNADAAAEAMAVFELETEEAPAKPARTRRRSAKINADDVVSMVGLSSSLTAMMLQQPHWVIPDKEVRPWAAEAAELLNRIPSTYVKAVTDMSGFIVVGAGIYQCMMPRIEATRMINAQRKAERDANARRLVESATTPTESDIPADVPWGVPA